MSKIKTLLFVLVLVTLLAACGGGAEEVAEESAKADWTVECGDEDPGELPDLGGQEIIIAVENAYPPFNNLNDAGEGIGWDYDVARAICEDLNCTPVFTEAAWDGIFPAMAAGEYDVLFDGVTFTDERDEAVDFSCAYVVYGQSLLVRADEDAFANPDEFKANEDLVIATQLGTTNEIIAHEFVGVDRTQSFEDFGLAVQSLLTGDNDAVMIDVVAAVGFISENPGELKLIPEGVTSDEQLALVFPPGSEYIDPFTKALHAMAQDGSLGSFNDKWFNP